MKIDIFLQVMAGALHAAQVELSEKEWGIIENRLQNPLPVLSDGQIFAYEDVEGGIMYSEYSGETDLEQYPHARHLTQAELGSMVMKLRNEFSQLGFSKHVVEQFEAIHKPI